MRVTAAAAVSLSRAQQIILCHRRVQLRVGVDQTARQCDRCCFFLCHTLILHTYDVACRSLHCVHGSGCVTCVYVYNCVVIGDAYGTQCIVHKCTCLCAEWNGILYPFKESHALKTSHLPRNLHSSEH